MTESHDVRPTVYRLTLQWHTAKPGAHTEHVEQVCGSSHAACRECRAICLDYGRAVAAVRRDAFQRAGVRPVIEIFRR